MHLEWKQQMTRVTLIKNDSVFVDWLTIKLFNLFTGTTIVTEVALGVIRNWDVHLWVGVVHCTLQLIPLYMPQGRSHQICLKAFLSVHESDSVDTSHTTCRPLTMCLYLPPGRVTSNLTQGISWCPWHCGHIWPCEYASPFDRSRWISPHAYASDLCILPTSLCLLPWMSCHLISIQSCLISQVGLLPVHAAHLTTSQLGLTPVSQWMVCMARCGEVCNRGKWPVEMWLGLIECIARLLVLHSVFIHFAYFMLLCLLLSTTSFLFTLILLPFMCLYLLYN